MFSPGMKVKVHGGVWKVVSVHNKGKSVKVSAGSTVTFKRAADCAVAA